MFFWESAFRLSHHTLKVSNDRVWEVNILCFFVNILRCQIILHHEDSHITNSFGRRSNFNNVTQHIIYGFVHCFYIFKLLSQTKAFHLWFQVGILTARNFVFINLSCTRFQTGLKLTVNRTNIFPVVRDFLNIIQINAGFSLCSLNCSNYRA